MPPPSAFARRDAAGAVRLQQLARQREHLLQLLVVDGAGHPGRVDAAEEQHLRSEHVAGAGGDALIQQHLAHRLIATGAQPGHRLGGIERRAQQIGPQTQQRRRSRQRPVIQELRHRDGEADGDEIRRLDQHAQVAARPLPALARPVDVPAAVHAHVGPQGEAAGEPHQQVLALGLDRLDRAAGDGRLIVDAGPAGRSRSRSGSRSCLSAPAARVAAARKMVSPSGIRRPRRDLAAGLNDRRGRRAAGGTAGHRRWAGSRRRPGRRPAGGGRRGDRRSPPAAVRWPAARRRPAGPPRPPPPPATRPRSGSSAGRNVYSWRPPRPTQAPSAPSTRMT